MHTTSPLAERLLAQSTLEPTSGCWIWSKALSVQGYGVFRHNSKVVRAHRMSYETFVRAIPEGLEIDHICRNRACINPAHLEPVTSRENTMRGNNLAAINARKTHCPAGHELSGANLYTYTSHGGKYTHRKCRTCQRELNRALLARKRG